MRINRLTASKSTTRSVKLMESTERRKSGEQRRDKRPEEREGEREREKNEEKQVRQSGRRSLKEAARQRRFIRLYKEVSPLSRLHEVIPAPRR